MYDSLQTPLVVFPWQGILYPGPVMSFFSVLSLGATKHWRSVLVGLKLTLMPKLLKFLRRASETPLTYKGVQSVLLMV